MNTQPTPLAPLNNLTPERVFLAKNYYENCDPRGILRTPTDVSAAHCGVRRLLGRVVILVGGRTCASADGEQLQWSRDTHMHGRTDVDVSSRLGSALSTTQYEVVQYAFKSSLDPKDCPG